MWIRSMTLICAAGCLTASNDPDSSPTTVTEHITGTFIGCALRGPQEMDCSGTISIFPVEIRIISLVVLDNVAQNLILNGVGSVAKKDANSSDPDGIANDLETRLFNDLVKVAQLPLTKDDITVCVFSACR